MQEASFRNILNTLITIIVVYYALKILARLFLPLLAKKVVEKAEQQFKNQQNQYQNTTKDKQESKSKETNKVGEYIDYEEVD